MAIQSGAHQARGIRLLLTGFWDSAGTNKIPPTPAFQKEIPQLDERKLSQF